MAVYSHQLQYFLNKELLKLDRSAEATCTKQDRYCVHKVCFERLIDQHSTYRDLLSRIKAEYEECIEAIERGQREAVYLSGKLAAKVMEPETIRIFQKRADELELKVGLLKILNQRLESPLKSSCRVSSKQQRSSYRNSSNCVAAGWDQSVYPTPLNVVIFVCLSGSFLGWDQSSNPSRSYFLPNLTLEQLTDTVFLTKKLADLHSKVAQVKLENETRFVPKAMKGQLFNRLQEKEVIKEALLSKREELKMKIMATKLSLAVEENKYKTFSGTVGKIALALKETNLTMEKADEMCEEPSEEPTDDKREKQYVYNDPTKDREAEFILEYIENFFELFEAGKVEDGALLAAHSPKGVLRTMETLEKFKEYDETHSGSSIFVAYWEALLPTVATGCKKPSEWETIECIKCVLERGRTDLLTHWIAQDQLTLSEQVGRLITDDCRCPDR
ncbi:Clathrin heavy chain linker domain-containing protein 1 [Desmophyllum pertusum]|uniref:Clathrin heavy chain linker domain-containing protein 1 n=1 Tax=Desmophyllum pertusum TaxID=174260 RepID=A0A9W9Z2J8_9CNID|nr:Clathrin heavy chain linker domain-containing protein 1 [Desmophyllum pertusum]